MLKVPGVGNPQSRLQGAVLSVEAVGAVALEPDPADNPVAGGTFTKSNRLGNAVLVDHVLNCGSFADMVSAVEA
jgi:hypothetical protein